MGGGRDGDAVRDCSRHLLGDAVRLVADDHNVVAVEFEPTDIFTTEEGAEDVATRTLLFQKFRK